MIRTTLALLAIAGSASAQSSAQGLAEATLQKWATDAREKVARSKGLASVVRTAGDRAVLLISGVPLTGNSGDDTIASMGFSGPYEARLGGGRWELGRRIPLEELGQIVSQDIQVSVHPGKGVDVVDRMTVRLSTGNGFAARLNHRAELRRVEVRGRTASHQFGGGLLWVDTPAGQAELTLAYSLPVEPQTENSGSFQEAFGHIRNQYFWHPFFDFGNSGDLAQFRVELRIPRAYYAVTSLPQSERVEGADRIVEGRTVRATHALSVAYDRDWRPEVQEAGKVRLHVFVTPEFRPEAKVVAQELRAVHNELAARFGEMEGDYVAVVQLRGDPENYWHFSSNQAVFAAGSPGYTATPDGRPGAPLAHEVAHFWTQGAGPAADFLREGWATYAESLALERRFGTPGSRAFWRYHAQEYFRRYDGKVAIFEDHGNTNLNHDKGAWIFRMLERAVGREAFSRGMAEFSRRSLAGEADWETLAACFPGFDARAFLLPWLKERSAPQITTRVEGRVVTLHQEGPYFPLRIDVEGTTAQGLERREVVMGGGDARAEFSGEVSDVRVDPDQLLLFKR